MSLGIINKNTSSPFMLRRSIVDQGGQGGAYESGGFNPEQGYSDGGAANAIAALGSTIGAGLAARTAGDKNKEDLSTSKRLDKKSKRINDKISSSDTSEDKKNRLEKRLDRVGKRQTKVSSRISEYNEMVKPTLTSDLKKI
jgi:hypothetical protein